jgi:hypothetical protein
VVTRQGKHDTRPLITATKADLIHHIQATYEPIRSFNLTVDMTPSIGSVYKGEITEYPSVRGYILYQKPDDIRIIGLDPVIHSRAFDMVSQGPVFRVYLASKNLFIEGRNDAPATSKNKIENLRPEAFLDAILIRPPDPAKELSVLEDDTDENQSFYILMILRQDNGELHLLRNVYFDRLTLNIVRQKTFDPAGNTASDTRYSQWKAFDGVLFPTSIDINRPEDGYGVVMQLTRMLMNAALRPDQFVLQLPEGARTQVMGQPPTPAVAK